MLPIWQLMQLSLRPEVSRFAKIPGGSPTNRAACQNFNWIIDNSSRSQCVLDSLPFGMRARKHNIFMLCFGPLLSIAPVNQLALKFIWFVLLTFLAGCQTPLVVSCALWEPTGVPLRLVVSQNDECQPESLPLLCAASISICWSKIDSSCQPSVSCKCHQCLSHGFFPLHDYGFSYPSL